MKCTTTAIALTAFLLAPVQSQRRTVRADAPPTRVSVVDYLKSVRKDSSLAARKKLFGKHFPDEKYRRSASQNLRLLEKLISAEKNGARTKKAAAAAAEKNSSGKAHAAFARWAPNLGINATYSVGVHYAVSRGRFNAREFRVSLYSAAAVMANLTWSGEVKFFIAGEKKPFHRAGLKPITGATIGPRDPKMSFKEIDHDKSFKLPKGKKVRAEVTVHPVISF